MNQIPKASFTPDFRAEAVRLAHAVGGSEAAGGRRLSLSIRTLANWPRADKAAALAKVGNAQHPKPAAGAR